MKTCFVLAPAGALCVGLAFGHARAGTTAFFDASQGMTVEAPGATSDTLRTGDYLFTYSQDKWWYPTISIGPGVPTGRFRRMEWPEGLHAQAITAGPSGLLTYQESALVTIRRADGAVFDIVSFAGKLLGSTAGAGGAFEIMPKRDGNDGFADPLTLDATGNWPRNFLSVISAGIRS